MHGYKQTLCHSAKYLILACTILFYSINNRKAYSSGKVNSISVPKKKKKKGGRGYPIQNDANIGPRNRRCGSQKQFMPRLNKIVFVAISRKKKKTFLVPQTDT